MQSEINAELSDKIDNINYNLTLNKGFFLSESALNQIIPEVGNWAVVFKNNQWLVAVCEQDGVWTISQNEYEFPVSDMAGYVKSEDLQNYYTKQQTDSKIDSELSGLQSQVDNLAYRTQTLSEAVDEKLNEQQLNEVLPYLLKTINGQSIVGSGNISISGGADSTKHIFIEQTEYDALEDGYEEDALYFILDPSTNPS